MQPYAAWSLQNSHSHVTKALEDCTISNDEYKPIQILDKVDKYHVMKDVIRHKIGTGSVLDEETKIELVKCGPEQAYTMSCHHHALCLHPSKGFSA